MDKKEDVPFLFTRGALSDEHYKALGQFVAEFATFEWLLGELVCELTKLSPNDGALIVSRLGLQDMLIVAEAIIEMKFDPSSEFKQRFNSIAVNIRDAAPIRNRLVHGQWHESDEPGFVVHWDFRGGARTFTVKTKPVQDKEIFGWAEGIARLTLSLSVLCDDLAAARASSHEAPSQVP